MDRFIEVYCKHRCNWITYTRVIRYSNCKDKLYILRLFCPCVFMVSGYSLLNRGKVEYKYVFHKILRILIICFAWGTLILIVNNYATTVISEIYKENKSWKLLVDAARLVYRNLWHFWFFLSISVCYVTLPFLSRHRCRLKYIWGLLLLISISIQVASYFLHYPLQKRILEMFRFWTWIQYFCLGGLLKEFSLKIDKKYVEMVTFALTLVVLFFCYYMSSSINDNHIEFFYDSTFFIIWIFLLVTTFEKNADKIRGEWITYFSTNLSIGVYIIHVFIIKFLNEISLINSSICLWISTFIITTGIVFAINRVPIVNRLIRL